eukprot:5352785-Alexandrium_andersonii.AAC.1
MAEPGDWTYAYEYDELQRNPALRREFEARLRAWDRAKRTERRMLKELRREERRQQQRLREAQAVPRPPKTVAKWKSALPVPAFPQDDAGG